MREIKFRGLSKESDKWIYGAFICDKGEAFILNGVIESTDEYIAIEDWRPVKVKSIGQFTGLKDKNGVEIYEGDILENSKDPISIIYLDGAFKISYLNMILCESLISDYHLKVIGNIYENTELLEECQ